VKLIACTACALALAATALPVAHADGGATAAVTRTGGRCPEGHPESGDLGIESLLCVTGSCAVNMRSGSGFTHQFSTEPRIRGLLDGSPADGKLEDSDILIAIDGVLITTREGGRRLANLKPGVPVTLRIRRDREEMDVTLVPRLGCNMPSLAVMADPVRAPAPRPAIAPRAVREAAPAPSARPAIAPQATREAAPAATAVSPRPAAAPRAAVAPVIPPFTFGLELECGPCGWRSESGGAVRWSSPSLPTIRSVEPGGPGEQAGLKPGDVLVEIDGHLLNNEQAGREIGKLRPGHAVQVRFLRGREDKTVALTPRGGVPPAQPF
jgi:hypothetical protein